MLLLALLFYPATLAHHPEISFSVEAMLFYGVALSQVAWLRTLEDAIEHFKRRI